MSSHFMQFTLTYVILIAVVTFTNNEKKKLSSSSNVSKIFEIKWTIASWISKIRIWFVKNEWPKKELHLKLHSMQTQRKICSVQIKYTFEIRNILEKVEDAWIMNCLKKYYLKIAEKSKHVSFRFLFFWLHRNCFQFFFMYLCMFNNIYIFFSPFFSIFSCNGCTNQFLIHFRVKYFTFPFLFWYKFFWHFFSSSLRFGLSFLIALSLFIFHIKENWTKIDFSLFRMYITRCVLEQFYAWNTFEVVVPYWNIFKCFYAIH